ncbi:uncharacterized protein PHALS_08055 [Plasmopara halstedii]|uniref:Uncharacterized protein n=1 Tax=Plasmopara halstedii TaxID=4781 RepID=A0A0P1B8L3_PLAHL|nr:uncharacterized protein PHALS_08055 [Plasmopara halstedii]CEG50338.1 hypothetical protein PHALS_08055 [Plasmopara halstedii]|eukprot:XP_024586707.1 hypothetical protein PHALS_08055 [Plasmopara halstedii]
MRLSVCALDAINVRILVVQLTGDKLNVVASCALEYQTLPAVYESRARAEEQRNEATS